jgi:hypothetical protein
MFNGAILRTNLDFTKKSRTTYEKAIIYNDKNMSDINHGPMSGMQILQPTALL